MAAPVVVPAATQPVVDAQGRLTVPWLRFFEALAARRAEHVDPATATVADHINADIAAGVMKES